MIESIAPDLDAVKQRQQAMWASGDFHAVAALIQPVADDALRRRRPPGRLARPRRRDRQRQRRDRRRAAAAATSSASTTSRRSSPAGAAGPRPKGSTIELLEGDAEAIPFPDASFDAVVSVFGSMFAPDHARAAAELARVVPPRRPDRARDLDARRLHRRDAEGRRGARAARRRASPRRSSGARRPTSASCSATRSTRSGCQERTFTFRFRSAEALRRVLPRPTTGRR